MTLEMEISAIELFMLIPKLPSSTRDYLVRLPFTSSRLLRGSLGNTQPLARFASLLSTWCTVGIQLSCGR